jgi:DNA-binding transcriptional MocR family regulator
MLAAAQQPDVISFAGGLPAPDSFDGIKLGEPPRDFLQYGATEGECELREKISRELAGIGLICPASRILVLSGSQQGIDLTAKLCIDPGTAVAIEEPSYLAALQVFRFFGATLQTFDTDWSQFRPSLAYVTPTFQNPTGRCWSRAQREVTARNCDLHDTILFEDDPYRDLSYDPCDRTPICSLIKTAPWIYQGSFSKTVAPGLRIGFLAASEAVFAHLVHLKQAADLHTNRLSQWIVLQYLNDHGRQERLEHLVARYRKRRDLFANAMERHLGGLADWDVPPGGLFFWATLRGGLSAESLLQTAIPRKVLFTPGSHFSGNPSSSPSTLRLNFSHADAAKAEKGLAILGELIRQRA